MNRRCYLERVVVLGRDFSWLLSCANPPYCKVICVLSLLFLSHL